MIHNTRRMLGLCVMAAALAWGAGPALAEHGDAARQRHGHDEAARQRHGHGEAAKDRGSHGADRKLLAGPKVSAEAGPHSGGRGFAGDRRAGPMQPVHEALAALNLSEEQKNQVRAIFAEARQKQQAFEQTRQREGQALREQMERARQSGNTEQAQEIRSRMQALMSGAPRPPETLEKVRAVLNEQQRAEFDARLEAIRAQMRGMGTPMAAPGRSGDAGPAARDRRGEGRPQPLRDGRERRQPRRELDL